MKTKLLRLFRKEARRRWNVYRTRQYWPIIMHKMHFNFSTRRPEVDNDWENNYCVDLDNFYLFCHDLFYLEYYHCQFISRFWKWLPKCNAYISIETELNEKKLEDVLEHVSSFYGKRWQ